VVITPAMPEGNCLSIIQKEFPDRVFDVGICEQHAGTFAAGLATQGYIPVVAIYSTFLQRSFDQIIHDVCLQRLPVVFAVDRAGLVGADGPTHHGAFDLSFLRIVPGLTVFVPKDEAELQQLLATALQAEGPSVIRYPRAAGSGVPLRRPIVPFQGPWVEVTRAGSDVLGLAVGPVVQVAEEAARTLATKGVEATVACVKRIHPFDSELLAPLLQRHRAVVTLEDNALAGGFGSAVAEFMVDAGICRPLARKGLPDCFVAQGPVGMLRRDIGLTAEGVAESAMGLLQRAQGGPA